MSRGLATQYAPSFALIQAHFGAGVVGLLAFSAALVLRAPLLHGFFVQPLVIGLVHLCVLGWLVPIAMGALHQLVPVIFEAPVRSEKLAWTAFGLYVLAVPALIHQLWTFQVRGWLLPLAATAAAGAVWLYAAHLLWTIFRAKERSLTGAYVTAALGWLMVAVLLGATLAWNLFDPFLPLSHLGVLRAHAHVAGLGFFGLLIMGVAYRLLEMFLLSHGAPERAGWISLTTTNAALVLLFCAFAFGLPGCLPAAVVFAATGLVSFFVQVRLIYRRRTNRRVEVAWRHTFASLVYLGAASLAGMAQALLPLRDPWSERMYMLYGLLALPGFMGSIVVGQLYKILPFLVWLHRFSKFIGVKKVPSTSELLSERPKYVQYLLMHGGLALLAVGLLVDAGWLRVAGAASFAASSVLFARNLAVISTRRA